MGNSVEDGERGLMEKTTESFEDLMSVTEFLKAGGFQCSKSSVYRHAAARKLLPGKDGRYSLAAVQRYARRFLRNANDPLRQVPKDPDDLQHRKLNAEIARLEAQARIAAVREKVMSGTYMPREDAERDLARRAAFLKNDMRNFIHAEAPRMVAFVNGSPDKVPEVMEHWNFALDEWLARYAEDRPFVVAAPPPVMPADPGGIDEGGQGETEEALGCDEAILTK